MVLKSLYTILLGIFLVLFVGIGINTFYPEPMYQATGPCIAPPSPQSDPSIAARQCQKDQQAQQEKYNFYSQIVSSIALVAAVIYFVISFTIFENQQVFSYGFLFGSMFTLLYSLVRGLNSNHAWFAFIIIVVSLCLVMFIGYKRFAVSDPLGKTQKN